MDNKTFINALAGRLGRDKEDVEVILKSFTALIGNEVKEGSTVSIPGFGSFEPKMRPDRETIHPSTGRKILVPPKLSLVFKPSAILRQKVRK